MAEACFNTDGHDQYATLIQHHFPESSHTVHPSERGCVTGQGELKTVGFDPLFSINHTLAMRRANINRLVAWCAAARAPPGNPHANVMVTIDARA